MLVLIGGFRYRKRNEMPCYYPIEVNIQRKAIYTPGRILDKQVVPCGNCIGCRAEQSRQWAVRMMHESRLHYDNVFVTLTLDSEHMNENSELCAKDFSGFIKRLRKTQERRISFFGCGEYGELSARPHYHALLFGITFLDKCDRVAPSGRSFEWSKTLEDIWGRGICEVGTVTMASCSYVSGYIGKKMKAKDRCRAVPFGKNRGELLAPEFARMSLRPAIGKNWIKKHWRDVYPRDYVVVDGVEAKPPRYYDVFMDFRDEKGGSQERRDIMDKVRWKRRDEAVDLDAYSLKAAEKMKQSKIELHGRRIGI